MNIYLAPEANHISKIKCKHRFDRSSLATCYEPSFFKSEVKTLRPHLHLHGGCWFPNSELHWPKRNMLFRDVHYQIYMGAISKGILREWMCLLPLMFFGRFTAACRVLQSLLVLCHGRPWATVHQPYSRCSLSVLRLGLGTLHDLLTGEGCK